MPFWAAGVVWGHGNARRAALRRALACGRCAWRSRLQPVADAKRHDACRPRQRPGHWATSCRPLCPPRGGFACSSLFVSLDTHLPSPQSPRAVGAEKEEAPLRRAGARHVLSAPLLASVPRPLLADHRHRAGRRRASSNQHCRRLDCRCCSHRRRLSCIWWPGRRYPSCHPGRGFRLVTTGQLERVGSLAFCAPGPRTCQPAARHDSELALKRAAGASAGDRSAANSESWFPGGVPLRVTAQDVYIASLRSARVALPRPCQLVFCCRAKAVTVTDRFSAGSLTLDSLGMAVRSEGGLALSKTGIASKTKHL